MKPDLDSKENIKIFIEQFYDLVLVDPLLAHIFTDVAGIDVNVHIPIIRTYWEKLLLGEDEYKRHTMNIHRNVHAKFPFTRVEFDRWLLLFKQVAKTHFSGVKTDRAIQIASSIAMNMDVSLNKK
jgi:hemoglobin